MTTQSKIELALSLWVNGESELFQEVIREQQDNILNYQGRGDVWTYLMPALLLEGLWSDFQDCGFPMERIVYSQRDVVAWLAWPKAVAYMRSVDPELIAQFVEFGVDDAMLFQDDTNLDITMDYYNTDLRAMVEDAIDRYQAMSDLEWEEIFQNIQ